MLCHYNKIQLEYCFTKAFNTINHSILLNKLQLCHKESNAELDQKLVIQICESRQQISL